MPERIASGRGLASEQSPKTAAALAEGDDPWRDAGTPRISPRIMLPAGEHDRGVVARGALTFAGQTAEREEAGGEREQLERGSPHLSGSGVLRISPGIIQTVGSTRGSGGSVLYTNASGFLQGTGWALLHSYRPSVSSKAGEWSDGE